MEIPNFITVYTGNGIFSGDTWQVYKHNPSKDTEETLCYLNYDALKIYKIAKPANNNAIY